MERKRWEIQSGWLLKMNTDGKVMEKNWMTFID